MNRGLSVRQQRILDFIDEFMEEAGWRHVRRVDGSQFFRPVLIGTK